MQILNTIKYFGSDQKQHCGYCNQRKGAKIRFVCDLMGCGTYEKIIHFGWRRCGTYYYKVNPRKNCCATFTIILNVQTFILRNSQKDTIRKNKKALTDLVIAPPPKQQKIAIERENQAIDAETGQKVQQLMHRMDKQILPQVVKQVQAKLGVSVQVIQLSNKAQIFPSKNRKKEQLTTNYWMLLYGLVKKCNPKITMQNFTATISPLANQLKSQYFAHIQLLPNGYQRYSNKPSYQIIKQKLKEKQIIQKPFLKQQVEKPISSKKELQFSHLTDWMKIQPNRIAANKLRVQIGPAQFQKQAFRIYQAYSKLKHDKQKQSEKGYTDFLCLRALAQEERNGLKLGCKHWRYYIEDQLAAVGVVDVLPQGLSSVYFFYHPKWQKLSLGTFSSLLQIRYVQQMSKLVPTFHKYYLGFYIQDCKKMVYKGNFEPAFLICPITYREVVLDEAVRKRIDDIKNGSQEPRLSHQTIIPEMNLGEKELKQVVLALGKFEYGKQSFRLKDVRPEMKESLANLLVGLLKQVGKHAFHQITMSL